MCINGLLFYLHCSSPEMESPDVAWSRQVIYDPAYDYSVMFR